MGLRGRALLVANAALRPMGLELHRAPVSWDGHFRRWLRTADPHAVGDAEWGADNVADVATSHFLPLLGPDRDVLEVGPGTGRLTRFLIGHCRHLALVDVSPVACRWLRQAVPTAAVHRHALPSLAPIATSSVDVVLAHGVVDHLALATIYGWLLECHRVGRAGAAVAFTWCNLLDGGGIPALESGVFRPHAPEALRYVANQAGFTVRELLPVAHLDKSS